MLHDHDDIKHARKHVRDGAACNLQRIPLRCASAFSALIKRAARYDDNATTTTTTTFPAHRKVQRCWLTKCTPAPFFTPTFSRTPATWVSSSTRCPLRKRNAYRVTYFAVLPIKRNGKPPPPHYVLTRLFHIVPSLSARTIPRYSFVRRQRHFRPVISDLHIVKRVLFILFSIRIKNSFITKHIYYNIIII